MINEKIHSIKSKIINNSVFSLVTIEDDDGYIIRREIWHKGAKTSDFDFMKKFFNFDPYDDNYYTDWKVIILKVKMVYNIPINESKICKGVLSLLVYDDSSLQLWFNGISVEQNDPVRKTNLLNQLYGFDPFDPKMYPSH